MESILTRSCAARAGLDGSASTSVSRRGSVASLTSIQELAEQEGEGEEGAPVGQQRRPEGLRTFVKRIKDDNLLE
jgi:hypothetical protein